MRALGARFRLLAGPMDAGRISVLFLATSRSLGWPARETCFVVIAILSSEADDASQIGSPASGLPTYAGIASGEGTAAHYRVHLPAACASAEGVWQPTIAGASWTSSSFSRASTM